MIVSAFSLNKRVYTYSKKEKEKKSIYTFPSTCIIERRKFLYNLNWRKSLQTVTRQYQRITPDGVTKKTPTPELVHMARPMKDRLGRTKHMR